TTLPRDCVDGRAQRRIPDLITEVVVYCSDATCNSSIQVATRLLELGYENVSPYAEGKNDWGAAGGPPVGGRGRASARVPPRHPLLGRRLRRVPHAVARLGIPDRLVRDQADAKRRDES